VEAGEPDEGAKELEGAEGKEGVEQRAAPDRVRPEISGLPPRLGRGVVLGPREPTRGNYFFA